MYFVVDQNVMRKRRLRELFDGEHDVKIIVPDCALEELVRHPEWEATLQQSFRIMASEIHRTVFSASIGELLRYERDRLIPVTRNQILPPELTDSARGLVISILTKETSPDIAQLRDPTFRLNIARQRPAPDQIKAELVGSVTLLKSLNGVQLTREIRSGRMTQDARLGLLKLRSDEIARNQLGDVAQGLKLSDFMTTRLVYASLWYKEFWLNGGLDDAKPKTLANDDFDMEYSLIASFFDGLLSEDRRANACYDALRRLTDTATEDVLYEALEQHAIATGRLTQPPSEPNR